MFHVKHGVVTELSCFGVPIGLISIRGLRALLDHRPGPLVE